MVMMKLKRRKAVFSVPASGGDVGCVAEGKLGRIFPRLFQALKRRGF
jgi:hypothetical protein